MSEVTKIERAISKKELKNQEDVTDVVISEMIHEIQDKIEEVEKKVKSNHEKIKNIYPKAKEEFDKHVSTAYETVKKDFKEKFLDPLGIENTVLSVSSQSHKDEGYFSKETGMIIFALSNSREKRYIGDNYIGNDSLNITKYVKFSELTDCPSVTESVALYEENKRLKETLSELRKEKTDVSNSKSRISTAFKRKTLEGNDVTKKMLDEAKASMGKYLSPSKQLTTGESNV